MTQKMCVRESQNVRLSLKADTPMEQLYAHQHTFGRGRKIDGGRKTLSLWRAVFINIDDR